MAFDQVKLDRSINQSRGIFDKYIYKTADSIADVTAAGYFSQSRFLPDSDWVGGVIECSCSDGFFMGQIQQDGSAKVILSTDTLSCARRQVLRASDITNQIPSALLTPEVVAFGSAQVNGPSDPIEMSPTNRFTCNQAGNFHLRLSTQAGRASQAGTGLLYLGVFLNPGIGSFIQFGQSVEFVIPNANSDFAYQAELTADLEAGWQFEIRYQIDGAIDTGLYANTSVPNGWNDVFSADAVISQYFIET